MKKLALLLAVVFISVATFGQTPTATSKTTTKTDQVKPATKTQTVAATQTKTIKTVADTSKTKVAVKKDGTPDKRFKANKTTSVKPKGPVKKDGTPDMRYKTNKDTTKVKK
jgi:hypothetical protein